MITEMLLPSLTDNKGCVEGLMRRIANRIGIDPWDVRLTEMRVIVRAGEGRARSRFWFGSPCRFVRLIDVVIHVWLPCLVEERYPRVASRLRVTSPRWGVLHRRRD